MESVSTRYSVYTPRHTVFTYLESIQQLLSDTTTCEKPTLAAVTNLFETIDTIAMGGQHIALTTVDGCTYVIGWDGNGK